MSKIKKIAAFELYDSRGWPTVGARVLTEAGGSGFAIVPSGASTGSFEAVELRDGGNRIFGKGVRQAVENVNKKIAPELIGIEVTDQKELDTVMIKLDGGENMGSLGANATLAVSMAAAKAAADELGRPLFRYLAGEKGNLAVPRPMMNILNGGAHADNNLDIQEFMICPKNTGSFAQSMELCTTVYHTLKGLIKESGRVTAVGDEGGFAPNLESDEEALELICAAIEKAGYSFSEIGICIDAAASEWSDGEVYIQPKSGRKFTSEELCDYWGALCEKYPIISIEDGLGENDFEGVALLTKRLGDRIAIVGDDLFVTNKKRIKAGVLASAANSVLIKPNQIGTLTGTMEAINFAKEKGYDVVVSHRSGDSEDTFIADLAVAVGSKRIKMGAPCRSERVAKYNRLLVIEQENG